MSPYNSFWTPFEPHTKNIISKMILYKDISSNFNPKQYKSSSHKKFNGRTGGRKDEIITSMDFHSRVCGQQH